MDETSSGDADDAWLVYMILSSDNRIYTGITKDLPKRWAAHCAGTGARFFRGRRPSKVLHVELGFSHGAALSREYAIKQLSRHQKDQLVVSAQNQLPAHHELALSTS